MVRLVRHTRPTGLSIGLIVLRFYVGITWSHDGRFKERWVDMPWLGALKRRRKGFVVARLWVPFLTFVFMQKEARHD